jgi:hypothetical protein
MYFLTLRKQQKLQVSENKISRKVFGPKEDGESGQFTMLHNEELCDLYRLPAIVTVVKLRL